jgi:hypothetical protein
MRGVWRPRSAVRREGTLSWHFSVIGVADAAMVNRFPKFQCDVCHTSPRALVDYSVIGIGVEWSEAERSSAPSASIARRCIAQVAQTRRCQDFRVAKSNMSTLVLKWAKHPDGIHPLACWVAVDARAFSRGTASQNSPQICRWRRLAVGVDQFSPFKWDPDLPSCGGWKIRVPAPPRGRAGSHYRKLSRPHIKDELSINGRG